MSSTHAYLSFQTVVLYQPQRMVLLTSKVAQHTKQPQSLIAPMAITYHIQITEHVDRQDNGTPRNPSVSKMVGQLLTRITFITMFRIMCLNKIRQNIDIKKKSRIVLRKADNAYVLATRNPGNPSV